MPSNNEHSPSRDHDPDTERGGHRDTKGGKSKSSASSKAKDLSHVPCKFFKVGSCTAGASCPFSHGAAEPGAQKDVCTWFVKGNCKFAHKCALAHILPGQSMSMDRKNKKAAQAAAGSGGSREPSRGGKGQRREQGASMKNPLISGSTAPTRVLSGNNRSPMPMPLKATLSPSTPAPPLKDTEFAHFGLPDEEKGEKEKTGEIDPPSFAGAADKPKLSDWTADEPLEEGSHVTPSPSNALPMSPSRRPGLAHLSRPSNDLGPIGSPTRSVTSGTSVPRANGFSPGTSPTQNPPMPASPFTAPGTQTASGQTEHPSSLPFHADKKFRSGIAASLGANNSHAWNTELGPIPSQVANRAKIQMKSTADGQDTAIEDGDMEDFLPSSLNDLLTPEERSRRLSRSHSGQPTATAASHSTNTSAVHLAPRNPEGSLQALHRYSRSVPAPSLLGDIRSIWSERNVGSPGAHLPVEHDPTGMSIGSAGGSYTSASGMSGLGLQSFSEDQYSAAHAMLSPSNASAAFLPGFHHHYKTGNAMRPSVHHSGSSAAIITQSSNRYLPPTAIGNAPSMHSNLGPNLNPSRTYNPPANAFPSSLASSRPIPGGSQVVGGLQNESHDEGLSPSARALQSHAPGQSLPQGLAAGYSRIHALPSANLPSPGLGGSFTSAYGTSISPGLAGDWRSQMETRGSVDAGKIGAPPGLDNMFSRLSYTPIAPQNSGMAPLAPPPVRTVSGGRQWNALSPLSQPVASAADDDELFSFDG
ncbi:hypothetical protein BDV98DRAFT_655894 [Pterulicium gracile]|uniref:C3H1-type domain-containing protein n=1 Tax=Pterulicium gracile TaxID=1884261 RepID=A0A5C3QT18_9AGAR|nr:hypothetical protein BDV98DRAFT_655894 [Pterula gracilis]